MFTPKFEKKNAGTRSFQECVIKESIRCESISADLDVMSESAILWMTSADGVNGLCLNGARKMCHSTNKEKLGSKFLLNKEVFFYFKIVMSRI